MLTVDAGTGEAIQFVCGAPNARANSRWVQPPGLPSSGSMRTVEGACGSASASSRGARSSTWSSDTRPLGGISISPSFAIRNSSSVSLSPGP
ncbi:hypothetical protein [Sphingomonas segetis]|uniref:hypothetical protein n=1 Tax=Sphingomonas segetis TaxID=1104779 RepID=UPI003B845E9A